MRKIYSQETTRPHSSKQDIETTKNIPVYLPETYSSSRSHQDVVMVVMMMMMMMTIFSGESNCIINLPVVDGTATYSENIICNSASEKL